ncbi:hypothetical protein ACVMFA_000208 [Bradyrhizobium liaoningense]
MRLLDLECVEHRDRIVSSNRLRIGFQAVRHVRRRIAARGVADAAMAPAEITQLRLPALVIAAELVDEEDRRSLARFLHVQLHAIFRCDRRHRHRP